MTRRAARRAARALVLLGPLLLAAMPAWAASGAVLPGGSGREPVSVDAGKLDYFDKEQKLVYSGEVVARQGASTLKGSVLTIFLAKAAGDKDAGQGGAGGSSSIRSMDVRGPVTVISKDQVGTGDAGTYDKAANTMTLTGHVTLTQAANIVKGDRLVYDVSTGQAQVFGGQTQGRVMSVFTPGSSGPAEAPPKRKPAPRATTQAKTP